MRFAPAHVCSTVVGSDDVGGDDVVSWEDRHWKPMLEVVDWEFVEAATGLRHKRGHLRRILATSECKGDPG